MRCDSMTTARRVIPRSPRFFLLLTCWLLGLAGCEPPDAPLTTTAQTAGLADRGSPDQATPADTTSPAEHEPPACSVCAVSALVTEGECRPLWEAAQSPAEASVWACITARRCLDLRPVEQAYQCLADCDHSAIEALSPPLDRLVQCAFCACSRVAGACGAWVDFLDERLVGGACSGGS